MMKLYFRLQLEENEHHALIMFWSRMDLRKFLNLDLTVGGVIFREPMTEKMNCFKNFQKGNNICILIMIIHQVEFPNLIEGSKFNVSTRVLIGWWNF